MKALVVPVEGPLAEVDLSEDMHHCLKQLQDLVGGWIEAVSVPSFVRDSERAVAFVNEEGKLKGMPPNMRATNFLVPYGDYIAGVMVLCGYDPETGDTAEVPKGVVARAMLIEEEAR